MALSDEDELLRSVALQNARSILVARERAEDALRKQTEWLRITLASIGDAVISTDAGGRVTFLNGVAESLTGWPRDEALGLPLVDVFEIVNEGTGLPVENPALRALQEGTIVGLANHTVLIARDGTRRPIDDSAAPMRDEAGAPVGAVLVFRDVTERKRAEDALRASEERLRFLDALGESTRSSDDPEAVMAASVRLLGERLAATRVAYADVDADGGRFTIRHDWTAPGATSSVGVYSLDPFGPRVAADMRAGRTFVVRDVDAELDAAEGAAAFNTAGAKAVICRPLVKGGRLAAMMAAHQATPRDWTAAEIALVEEVVERSWAHIERVRDAASLREKDERIKLLIENTKDYAVIISDPGGTVIEWQGGAERITGYAASEAVGRKGDLIFTPEDREAGRPEEELRRAARDGRAEDRRWHQKKDGSRFFGDGVTTALRDDSGKLRGFGKVFKDATGEKRAEEATRRRAFQLQKLADIANRINSAHDVNSVIRVVTEEARDLVGAHQAATSMVLDPQHPLPVNVVSHSEKHPRGTDPPGIVGLDFYEAVADADGPVRLTRAELDAEPSWPHSGGPTPNGWLAAPLIGRNGRNMGLIQLSDKYEGEFTADDEAILVQLSQLSQLTAIAIENARLYQELRANDARKDEFLAMLAHELRNPLAAIGNAVKLTSKADLNEHVGWSMEVITRQMRHLSRLIDDLMDVSRITRGKIELRRDVIEITPILDSAADTVRTLVEERKHKLDLAIDRGDLWADVDPTRLEQVVVNLLNNAAKYSENAGSIRLSARNEAGEVVIGVKDRGVGIPPEKLPEMFELFAQGDRSLARSEGGLGIGLTVVKKLVEMHRGSVTATSEGPGRGSEFVIRLPAAHKPSAARPTAEAPAGSGGEKVRILVVDDNMDTARGMARLLKLLGHEVETAHTGPEAIKVAREHRPAFVLLDIGLPGMSGYEVASKLRQEECCKAAVIVAVSGYGQDEDRRRSKAAGFDHHLIKPLDHDALPSLLTAGGGVRA